jgi:hypothetical protein
MVCQVAVNLEIKALMAKRQYAANMPPIVFKGSQ